MYKWIKSNPFFLFIIKYITQYYSAISENWRLKNSLEYDAFKENQRPLQQNNYFNVNYQVNMIVLYPGVLL